MVPADGDGPFRVAGVLDEMPGRRGRHDGLHQAGVEAEALAVHGRAGVPEQLDRLVVTPDLDADLGQDAVGVLLDEVEAALVEQVVVGDLAFELFNVPDGPVTRASVAR